jgi:hypothetical protein
VALARARIRVLQAINGDLTMLRLTAVILGAALAAAGCGGSGYAVRPVPRIVADNVGKPVSVLQEAFGQPRKIDTTPTKLIYVWFLPQKPKDASPSGFQGCEMEVTVDARSQRVLGYSLSNIGWSTCGDVQRRIRLAAG